MAIDSGMGGYGSVVDLTGRVFSHGRTNYLDVRRDFCQNIETATKMPKKNGMMPWPSHQPLQRPYGLVEIEPFSSTRYVPLASWEKYPASPVAASSRASPRM